MADLVSVFAATAARMGEATALIAPGQRIGFAALDARARGFAGVCAKRGLRRGDRVLVAMPVGVDLFVALAGLWRLGAVVVFPEPAMGLAGLRHAVRMTRPRAMVASGAYRWLRLLPWLWRCRLLTPRSSDTGTPPERTLSGQDLALISFTSGSTGAPKAIPRSHGFLMAQYRAVAPLLEGGAGQVDLVAFPVFTLVNLAEGRASVLPDWPLSRPEAVTGPALARWIGESGATRALLPPALVAALAEGPPPPALQTVFTGGGPVTPALVDRLCAARPGLRVLSVYGSTEAEPIAELDWADIDTTAREAMRTGAGLLAGRPVPGLHLRIREDEIQVAGPHVNAGYLDPAQDAGAKIREGGMVWHRTGDAGRLDALGRLWLLGRHTAIAEGPQGRIYPFAAELAAETWPGVRRAALWNGAGGPLLAIEGREADPEACRARAAALGIPRIETLEAIPLDRRHRSKVDYAALGALLSGRRNVLQGKA